MDAAGAYTYAALLDASARVAGALLRGRGDLAEARVAYLVPPGFAHVAVQWGIWRAGGIAVPLGVDHPPPELDYAVRDSRAEAVVAHPDLAAAARPLAAAARIPHIGTREALGARPAPLPAVDGKRPALIVYTSGTTARPKGAVLTHANLAAQIAALVEAWAWTADDRILLVLPLHHVHGIVNVVACALWSGAVCDMLPRFDPEPVWARLAAEGPAQPTLFMAVPTIYRRLIAAWEAAAPPRRQLLSEGASRLRLMVSGSAALPADTFDRWREITGHTLLERYGMTEVGMALSNPLAGERRPGLVGSPLPGVEVRLVDAAGAAVGVGQPGELEVRGPGVFAGYWGRPEETRAAFRAGWFRTGDTAALERGAYRLLGRTATDILKSGGYKISALEIEEVLRTHPAIADCAVVGIVDRDWGDKICVAAELKPGMLLGLDELREWARTRLAPYKLPKDLQCVPQLPRNAVGKVIKTGIAKLF